MASLDYKSFYEKTYSYLLERANSQPIPIDEEKVKKYLNAREGNFSLFEPYKDDPMKNLYFRLAFHARNAQRISSTISFDDNTKVEELKNLLCDMDYKAVLKKFSNVEELQRDVARIFNAPGSSRRNFSYRYSKSLLYSAEFLTRYANFDELKMDFIRRGDMLPIHISFETHGFGIALACDFVKELGIDEIDFPKPDVHIKEILCELGFLKRDDRNLEYHTIFAVKDIAAEMTKAIGKKVTAYALDKIWWLISTETFYGDEDKRNVSDTKRKRYIEHIKKEFVL